MKLQIIQLEPYDDVISVRDRLAFVQAERVLLVWPRPQAGVAPVLCRKLDLVLIQREAARRGALLALVTGDPDIRDHARELNLSVFGSVRASQRGRWKKPQSKVFVDRSDRPKNEPDPYELMLHASRLRVLSPQQRLARRITRGAATVILVLTLLLAAYLALPGATVSLAPAQGQIDTTLILTVDASITAIDVEKGRIPGTRLTLDVESQASIPTTGISDVPSTLASGTVIFTNRIESVVDIPAGTILTTAGARPVRFRTLDDASVAAGVGRNVSVNVQAVEENAGPAGNVEAGLIVNIEGDLSRLLFVRNDEPMRGGTVREQSVVTQADYEDLALLARQQVRQDALAQISTRLSGSQIVAPESIRIVNQGGEEITYNAFVGDPADNLTATVHARVEALVLDEQAARYAALARLSAEIPPGRRLDLNTIAYSRGPISAPDAQGRVTFLMSASGNVSAEIDIERAKARIAGMSVDEALNTLNRDWLLDPRRPPQITLWPGFFGRLPLLPIRITIEITR